MSQYIFSDADIQELLVVEWQLASCPFVLG